MAVRSIVVALEVHCHDHLLWYFQPQVAFVVIEL